MIALGIPFQLLPGLLLTQQLEEAQAMLERRNRRNIGIAHGDEILGIPIT